MADSPGAPFHRGCRPDSRPDPTARVLPSPLRLTEAPTCGHARVGRLDVSRLRPRVARCVQRRLRRPAAQTACRARCSRQMNRWLRQRHPARADRHRRVGRGDHTRAAARLAVGAHTPSVLPSALRGHGAAETVAVPRVGCPDASRMRPCGPPRVCTCTAPCSGADPPGTLFTPGVAAATRRHRRRGARLACTLLVYKKVFDPGFVLVRANRHDSCGGVSNDRQGTGAA